MKKTSIEWLMDDLCVQYGFCLPPAENTRLISSPPATVDAFTDAVFAAEGLDPLFADKRLRRQVRERVRKYFETDETQTGQRM